VSFDLPPMDSDRAIGGIVGEYLSKEYEGLFIESETIFTLGLSTLQIAPADPERVWILIINTGNVIVSVASQETILASVGGIFLNPFGGGVAFYLRDDFTMPTRPWFAFSGVGGSVQVNAVKRDTRR
jgi:hypothetical protein